MTPKDPWKYNQQRRLHLLMKSAPSPSSSHLPRKRKKALTRWGRIFRQQLMAETFLTLEDDIW